MPAARALYVYYRVAQRDLPAVARAVRVVQARWCARHSGLCADLLQRADEGTAAEHVTLMETYARPGGVSSALQAAIEMELAAVLAPWLQGPRHVEVFLPCA